MPPTDESSDEVEASSTANLSGFERRSLLKALSVGASLSLGSGLTAAAEQDETTTTTATEQDDAEIDSLYGYSTPDATDVPAHLQPDHEVELLVNPPDMEAGTPPEFIFEPSGLHVSAGDIVQFTFTTPDHTVTAYHPANGFQQRVPNGVPPFSSPIVNGGGAWLYQFDEPGVYDLYCGPHHVLGMVMRVVVGNLDEETVPEYADTFQGDDSAQILAPYGLERLEGELNAFSETNEDVEWVWLTPVEVLGTDALDPLAIQDEGSVPFSAVRQELDGEREQTTTK